MVVGLAISLFQAVTSIHEQTLTFVPKALAVIGVLLLLLPWMVRSLVEFTTAVIQKMPQMVQYEGNSKNGNISVRPSVSMFPRIRASNNGTGFLQLVAGVPARQRIPAGAAVFFDDQFSRDDARGAVGVDRPAARAVAAAVRHGTTAVLLAVRGDDPGSERRAAARVSFRGWFFTRWTSPATSSPPKWA